MRSRSQIERPFSVYLTAGLIFFEVIVQLSYLSDAYRRNEVIEPVLLISTLLLGVLGVICGGFMLLGANWARILFIAGCFPFFLIYEVCVDGPKGVISAVVPAILCLMLLMQRSNLFFTGRSKIFSNSERDPYVRASAPRPTRREY